jgi:hypothetical protein
MSKTMLAQAVSYAIVLLAGMLSLGSGYAADGGLVAWWKFDEDQGNSAIDSVTGLKDALSGNFRYVEGVRGKCIQMDGYTTGILRKATDVPRLTDALTVEAWLAPQTYPWNWTPIVNQGGEIIPPKSTPPSKVDLTRLETGLIGAQFGDPKLTRPLGKLELQNTDSDWTGDMNDWSARWRGYLTTPETGEVTFEAEADLGVRLTINKLPVIDGLGRDKVRSGKLTMVKGEKYPVVLEYAHDGGSSYLRLYWSWAGQPRTVIPISDLGYSPQDEKAAREDVVPPRPPEQQRKPRVFFGLDAFGHLALKLELDGKLQECVSTEVLPLLRWTHVAGTFERGHGLALYINGKPAGALAVKGRLTPVLGGDLLLGKNIQRMGAFNSEGKASAEWPSEMVFDGLMDEVKIYDYQLPAESIARNYATTRPTQEQPLHWQAMPAGPKDLPARFAAVYCRLRYDDLWEDPWRVSDTADILVHFDESPVRFIFWRGTGYGGVWVTENGRWMADQSLERAGPGKSPLGCCEHMSDKQTRYSRVSIVENNDARIVLYWHYAICDIAYDIFAAKSPADWGEWADEYYVIYPDAVSVRHQKLWTDYLSHEWQETIFLNQPGTRPEDNVELNAMTFANMDGESKTYSWATPPPASKPPFPEPKNITIQMVNLKSKYKPFIIHEPGAVIKPFAAAIRADFSHFPWWNHWPVAQLPNDGRLAVAPDRPSHSSLSQSNKSVPDTKEKLRAIHKTGDNTYEVVTLIGMTEQPVASLTTLARSWNNPPKLTLLGEGWTGGEYDKYQRAFVLEAKDAGKPGTVQFTLQASEASPACNPAFVVRNWGESDAEVQLDGQLKVLGKDLRLGHEHRLEGSDLIVWIKLQATKPLTITMKPATE